MRGFQHDVAGQEAGTGDIHIASPWNGARADNQRRAGNLACACQAPQAVFLEDSAQAVVAVPLIADLRRPEGIGGGAGGAIGMRDRSGPSQRIVGEGFARPGTHFWLTGDTASLIRVGLKTQPSGGVIAEILLV